MRLQGRTAVVTGGASGIGAATVRRFVAEGAEVCIADVAIDAAEALADGLDGAAFAISCNVREEADVAAVAAAVAERWEHLDILVNNAGSELNKTYDDTSV